MIIKTHITPVDWRAFVRFVARRAGNDPQSRVTHLFIAVAIGALVGLLSVSTAVGLHAMSVWMGAACAIFWIWSVARIRVQKMAPAPDGYILGAREVDISDEGLRERSDRHESLFRWAIVRGVELSGEHLFIMVDTSAGFIVPLRSFASISEREEFVSEVQRHVSSCPRSAA